MYVHIYDAKTLWQQQQHLHHNYTDIYRRAPTTTTGTTANSHQEKVVLKYEKDLVSQTDSSLV